MNDWASAVESVMHLNLPWRTLFSQLVSSKSNDGSVDYQGWFNELAIKGPNADVSWSQSVSGFKDLQRAWRKWMLDYNLTPFKKIIKENPVNSTVNKVRKQQTSRDVCLSAAHWAESAGNFVPPSRHSGDHLQDCRHRQLRYINLFFFSTLNRFDLF